MKRRGDSTAVESNEINELREIPLESIKWSVRARGCLERSGCKTLWEVATRSDAEWLRMRNLGRGTLKEIKDQLAEYLRHSRTERRQDKRSESGSPNVVAYDVNELKDIPLESIKWSVRARGCLERAGCKTLWEVAKRSDGEWFRVRNLGRKTLKEIKDQLAEYLRHSRTERRQEIRSESGLSNNDRILLALLNSSDPLPISPSTWSHLVSELTAAGKAGERIGDIAARIGVKWPENRYDERLGAFLFPDLLELQRQRGLGVAKLQAIVRCAVQAWGDGRGITGTVTSGRANDILAIAIPFRCGDIVQAMESALILSGITKKERDIFVQRYGLEDGQPRTLETVGGGYGVTRERVRQIQESGRQRLVRPPDLHSALKQGLLAVESQLFSRLSLGHPGFIAEMSQHDLLMCLGGWAGLLVEVLHDGVDKWLNERAERTPIGWIYGGVTLSDINAASAHLTAYLHDCVIPVPVSVASRDTALPEPIVRLAALHGAGWIVGDFVSAHQLRSNEQRVLAAHVQTRGHCSPVLRRKTLPELLHPEMSEDPCSSVTLSREVGCFPQLLLRCGSEYVVRTTPKWEVVHRDVRPEPPPSIFNARGEVEAHEDRYEDGASLYDFGFQLMQTRKLWRMGELMDEVVRASRGRFSATSVGLITATHPRVQRFAPGLWGVKGIVITDAEYQLLLTKEDCERYVEARHARAEMTPFPMWNPDMEFRWCRWAKEHAPENIVQSLLSVIEPDQWSCSVPVREQWKHRQRTNGRYRLARPPRKSLAQLPVFADELLAATGAVVGRGGTSWMDLNVLHGRTIDSHRSAPFLALLVALGAVESPQHWQEHHTSTPAALRIFRQLCELWIESRKDMCNPLLDFVRAEAERYLRRDHVLNWASRAELQSLISVLGKGEIPADESEDLV